jgi:hypothetical protein
MMNNIEHFTLPEVLLPFQVLHLTIKVKYEDVGYMSSIVVKNSSRVYTIPHQPLPV